jgi:hypothetical protein
VAAAIHIPELTFQLSLGANVAGQGNWKPKKDLIAKRVREIGVARVLFGSDGYFGGGVMPAQAWADFRSLPLSEAEFRTIENNVTPYMR